MKKLLHSSINRLRDVSFRKLPYLMVVLFTFTLVRLEAQTLSQLECQCLNNDTESIPGLFEDRITINNGGAGPWTIVSSQGLYGPFSTPGNLVPLAPGTVITQTGPTSYQLNGRRVDNTMFVVVMTDGVRTLTARSIHTCQYPGSVIIGDLGVCINTTDTYSIEGEASRMHNINWTLSSGGTFDSPNGGKSITVDWGSSTGLAILGVTGQYSSYQGQSFGRCNINISQPIPVSNEAPTAMACNNHLYISMNNSCELNVTPAMILEDMTYPSSSYEIRLRDIQRDTIIPNGRIHMDYLDKKIEVAVIHECSGNSCWGYITMEDKSIPDLVCLPDTTIACTELPDPETTGFPVPDDAIVTKVRDGVYTVIGYDKCTELTMRYEDIVQSVHCVGDYSSIISRRWSIMDDAGNTDTCSSRIFIERATIGDITFPDNYDDAVGPNPSLRACANWPKLPDGSPDPYAIGGTGAPRGTFCLNVNVSYEDTRLEKCPDNPVTFKIRRKWSVTDECTGEKEVRTQLISVIDNQRPVATAPDEFAVGTNGYSCSANIVVPKPIVVFECSKWDYTVSYKVRDDSGQIFLNASTVGVTRRPDSLYVINNVPEGSDSVWIIYTITDACFNVTEVFTEVAIIDNLPPEPVCDRYSFVGLNDEGIAWAGVGTFDDGSHDNCGIEKIEIRRMNASPCGDPLIWSDKIKFCCEDLDTEEIMVSLRVTDRAGNVNTCMVTVTVQDNQPPVLKNCPTNRTVNCDADVVNLAPYGFPTVEDLCGATVIENTPVTTLDNCGRGTVVRTFVATDKSGNTATCTQTISVQAVTPFRASDIRWPGNHTVTNGCMDAGISPTDLPSGRQFPTYPNKPCSSVTHNYKDLVFQITEGACFKILREWTVIDWCTFDGITGAGQYNYTQVIMVQNSTPPRVTKGCNDGDATFTDLGNCSSRIIIEAEGSDDCSHASSLRWKYAIDVANDGSVDFTGNTNYIDRVIDHGTFKVTWTVTDECDNSSSCSKVFTVGDTKKPTPYCLSEIVTVIMEQVKEVAIWASDFDRGSFDNCSPKDKLSFSFSNNINETSRTFVCSDLTDGEGLFDLRMYVFDEAGNSDYCSIKVRIQDFSDNCEDDVVTKLALGGKIANEADKVVDDIEVTLTTDVNDLNKVIKTNANGTYEFTELDMYKDYTLNPYKGGSPLDGVSTLDLVLIQRHILSINRLTSPYKVIAADVNSDQKVSASDLVELRKLILGITKELPKGANWRFIDAQKQFNDPFKPFPYTEEMVMEGLDHSVEDANFVAVKVGDVNISHKTNLLDNSTDNRSQVEWILDQNTVNGLTKVAIEVDEQALAGFQFALDFDPNIYTFEGIEANKIEFTTSNIGLQYAQDGQVFISWNGVEPIDVKGNLLSILFSTKENMSSPTSIQINPGILSPEVYHDRGDVTVQNLTFKSSAWKAAEGNFELYQNIPNPFNDYTTIGFTLQSDSEVSFKVYDMSGKVLLMRSGTYTKGYNTIEVNTNQLGASGIMYYQLDTKTQSSSKKMIVIK